MESSTFELEFHGSSFNQSDIYKAIIAADHRKLLKVIQTGKDVHSRDEEFGMTYLHLVTLSASSVTEENFVPMVYQLSNAGIDVNAVNYRGETALKNAIEKNLQDIMVALFRVGSEFHTSYKDLIQQHSGPFELEVTMWHDKFHPGLWQAVAANDELLVTTLVSYWCRINISHRKYGRLQSYAKSCGASNEILNFLKRNEATLEVVHAVLAGDQQKLVNILTNNTYDLTIMDNSYQKNFLKPVTPRSLHQTALDMGFKHMLYLLPRFDAPGSNRNEKPKSQICAIM